MLTFFYDYYFRSVQFVKQRPDEKVLVTNKVQLLREPKGPDGTIGFEHPR